MPEDHARLDKWLWVARFFKTRALAAAAIDGGKIERNGERAKRGKPVRPGDVLRIRLPPYEHRITVLGLAAHRGSASLAATLYREEPESLAERERLREQHRLAAALHGAPEKGRPSKRDRREIEKLKGRE